MSNLRGNNLGTVLLAILVALVVLPTLVRALDYNVGVKAGDWMKYGQIAVTWSGNGTEPSYVTEEKKADWLRIDVESVSGTTVTLNLTIQFKNGTQTSQSVSEDVASGVGMSGIRVIIASHLKGGDPVVDQADSPTINRTITGIYAGATRNINLLERTTVLPFGDNQTTTTEIYWDQSTGVMVETHTKSPDFGNPGAYIENSFKATETNMWSADLVGILFHDPLLIIAGVIAVIGVIAALLAIRIRKPSAPPPTPPPSE